tara:strand:+ start:389 stop:598 length:210 start_codon:yes stop_codon:yes gene_type:complete
MVYKIIVISSLLLKPLLGVDRITTVTRGNLIVKHDENNLDPEVNGKTDVEPDGDPFVVPRDDKRLQTLS